MQKNLIQNLKDMFSRFGLGNGHKIVESELMNYISVCNTVGVARWDMDVDVDLPVDSGSVVIWSGELRKMLGYDNEEDFPNLFSSLFNLIHPDDKKDTLNAVIACIEDYTGAKSYNVEYRALHKNGDYRYFHAAGTVLRNRKGFPIKITGVQTDITDSKKLDELVRIHNESIERTKRSLESLYDVGASLLIANKSSFKKTLMRCMSTVGKIFNADRIQVWRNETVGIDLHFTLSNEWLSSLGTQLAAASKYAETYPYNAVPGWEEKLSRGKFINSPIAELLPHEYAFFNRQNVKSLVVIPLYKNETFWGFLRLDDCREERAFSDDEMVDITAVGQFIALSLIINENVGDVNVEKQKTAELTRWYHSVLDGVPIPILITDAYMNIVFLNNSAESMTGKHRDNIYGKHCSSLGTAICNTPQCGIKCAGKFVNRSYFKSYGKDYRVDVTSIKNENGDIIGYTEVMQDITVN